MKKPRQSRSGFLLIKCECQHEQIIFSHSSIETTCEVCGKVLSKPSGGKATILSPIVRVLNY